MNRAVYIIVAALLFTVSAQATKQPNIVLIISDDQAWTDYSFMGHIKDPLISDLINKSALKVVNELKDQKVDIAILVHA